MRAGGCTVQQALTGDAANVIKQSVTLARRRGHAQVTPLHVASTMLTSSTGLLRTACLQSHSHPLQCKALELCFNVALNRLPASTSSPMLGGHHHQSQFPSISNALVAAFKRAQAHQRRGSIENQQQPLLTVKIELEQLIISILDDPSVSRVMREAGFSSTQVKSNVEQAVSMEICSQSAPSSVSSKEINSKLVLSQLCDQRNSQQSGPPKPRASFGSDGVRDEDVMYVIENMITEKRRNLLVLGDCVSSIASVVKEVMNKVEKGDVPKELKDVKLITLCFSSFGHLNRIEVEKEIEELKCVVKRFIWKGVLLNLGDLKWATDQYRASSSEQRRGYYCPVEHMIIEVGKLCCGIGESQKFWVLGIADSQTYLRCKSGHPSIQTIWGLHTITIPAASGTFLRLSLVSEREQPSEWRMEKAENGSRWVHGGDEEEKLLSCCSDCRAKFDIETRNLRNGSTFNNHSTNSTLPAWLQQYKDQNKGFNITNNHKDSVEFNELCKKWNSICNSIHKQPYFSSKKTTTLCSISPSSSTSSFSYEHQYNNQDQIILEPKHSWQGHHIQMSETVVEKTTVPSLDLTDVMEIERYVPKFKEVTAENLTTLSTALEEKVPWQEEIVHDIASTILKCRSGTVKRKGYDGKLAENDDFKEETWFCFQGIDVEAKYKVAHELAALVFGSEDNLVMISLSSTRDEKSCCCYVERFSDEVYRNPHRVFVVEDVQKSDYFSQMGFKKAIERGKILNHGREVGLSDAIIILSCESLNQRLEEACDRRDKCDKVFGDEIEKNRCVSLDLNVCMEDDSIDIDQSIDDVGLLESVDRRIIFNFKEI